MSQIASVNITNLHFPLNEPFAVATRTAYEANNILLRLTSEDGLTGYGSSSPVEYITGESHDSVMLILNAISSSLIGLDTDRLEPLFQLAKDLIPSQPAARTALEMALLDLWGKHWKLPLWHFFGGAQTILTTDLTIPIVSPKRAAEIAKLALSEGFSHVKVKVGDPDGLAGDLARLESVARTAPNIGMRIDANQAFNPDSAVSFVSQALAVAPNIELVEQPVPKEDIDGLAFVHRHINVPLYADESAQTVESVVKMIRADAVDGINVKLMKSGICGAWQIASLCRTNRIKLMMGCMLESRLSLTAACALVAGTGWFDHVDLDSHRLLKPTNLFGGGMSDQGPTLSPDRENPGFGVVVNDSEWNNHCEPVVYE